MDTIPFLLDMIWFGDITFLFFDSSWFCSFGNIDRVSDIRRCAGVQRQAHQCNETQL